MTAPKTTYYVRKLHVDEIPVVLIEAPTDSAARGIAKSQHENVGGTWGVVRHTGRGSKIVWQWPKEVTNER